MVRGTFKGVNKVRRRLASGRYSVHYYHRATGRKLPGSPGTAEFARAWAEAEQAAQNPACRVLADLSQRFQNSTDFTHGLKPSTQSEYARMLGAIEVEFGDTPVAVIQDRRFKGDLLEWRDRLSKAGKLREAENRLTIAARLFAWGVGRGYIETNPLTTWERAYKADRSDKIWTPAQIEDFTLVATPVIQLALYLALYTGQRQGDLLKLMWSHYRDGRLYFRQGKGDRYMAVPCIARLRDLLDALRRSGDYTSTHILTAKRGQPWKKRWFSSTFADTCQRARITGLTFHDLRGTSITLLSEAGCTEAEIAAITGHSRKHVAQILERYTARTVLQANSAIDKLENSLRTNSANRLQTVRSLFSNSRGEDDASA